MDISQLHALFLQHPHICTDTRKIQAGGIFFALTGDNFNGNRFAQYALDNGCAYAVIDQPEFKVSNKTILVPDVLNCLQQLAAYHRRQWAKPVIALTGSNGKTTTKELMQRVLTQRYNCLATYGNLNNHIGVPLTLLQLTNQHELAIVEMGANHQKEIELLCRIAMPDYGVITNIGKAHLEGFGGEEGVLKGKGEMYDHIRAHGGKIFIHAGDAKLHSIATGIPAVSYGFNDEADISGKLLSSPDMMLALEITMGNSTVPVHTHLTGQYNGINVLCAAAVGAEFGIGPAQVKAGIESYHPDNNRSQVVNTGHNTLILDAYNANPSSMGLAIDNLAQLPEANKFFVLGDMREMGTYAPAEHKAILDKLSTLHLHGICVGHEFKAFAEEYNFTFFEDAGAARVYLEKIGLKGYTILVKGSRGIKLETLTNVL